MLSRTREVYHFILIVDVLHLQAHGTGRNTSLYLFPRVKLRSASFLGCTLLVSDISSYPWLRKWGIAECVRECFLNESITKKNWDQTPYLGKYRWEGLGVRPATSAFMIFSPRGLLPTTECVTFPNGEPIKRVRRHGHLGSVIGNGGTRFPAVSDV